MPTRKIAEQPSDRWSRSDELHPCRDPEHNPPSMRVFAPGVHEHECPTCHRKTVFRVPFVSL